MSSNISVREFYKGKNIFITGGSGFIGKVLIEKLLYSIPDIGNIYLLLRPKRGQSAEDRWAEMQRSPLFHRVRSEHSKKVVIVQGDVLDNGLGISSKDMKILVEEVSIVFHSAATVRMNATLKDSIAMNTAGTRRTLDVAKQFKKLVLFVYVSTAFCYPDYDVLGEQFHAPQADPHDVMRLCEWLDEKQIVLLTKSLLGQHPNTYTYSKRLSESLVNDAFAYMPTVIARPTIVSPAYREPLPGWVDNLNGAGGLMLGAGKGVIRTMMCDSSCVAQIIPVDGATNALIALGMIEGSKKTKPDVIPIYNLNVAEQGPTTWGEVLEMVKAHTRINPLAWPLWYPNGGITTNYAVHEMRRVLFHMVPAYFIDFLLLICGQKRFMLRVQEKVNQGLDVLQYFTMRAWSFPCPNYDAIPKILNEEEQEIYMTHSDNIDKNQYINNAIEGGRLYCLKEDPGKIHINRFYHNFLFFLDLLLKILFWCLIVSFLASWFSPVRHVLSYGGPIVKRVPFVGSTVFNEQ